MKKNRRRTLVKGSGMLKYGIMLIGMSVFFVVLIPLAIILFFPQGSLPSEQMELVQVESSSPVNVWIQSKGTIEQVPFEEYIKGVVASEMPATFEMEALKAQAVAARTYSKAKIEKFNQNPESIGHAGAPVCDQVHCQVYRSKEGLEQIKGVQWINESWEKINDAVNSTAGEVMTYHGEVAGQALFHSSSGGKTENSEDVFTAAVPYLKSVVSSYEQEAPYNHITESIPLDDITNKIKNKHPSSNVNRQSVLQMQVISRSSGDRVEILKVGDVTLSGRELREILGLRSANFTFAANGDQMVFTTTGYGHGVGMSQWGVNGMAKAGYTYDKILKHYYQGITIEKRQ